MDGLVLIVQKIQCTSQKSICAHTVSRKPDIFMVHIKKTKHVSQKDLFLVPKFIFLHSPNDKSFFFSERLYAHVACELYTRDFLEFFNILNYIKDAFQNKRRICPQEAKRHRS
jgi:hypothetical protein